MSWTDKILRLIPRPFKYIQKKLDIEQQWLAFKINLRPHRYKLTFLISILTFPLYRPYLNIGAQKLKKQVSTFIYKQTQQDQPAFKWLQNFITESLKNLLQHIFTDKQIKGQTLQFLHGIIKDEKFVNHLLQLLVSALQSPRFMKELKVAVSEILTDEMNNPQVRNSLISLLTTIASDPSVKNGFINLIQEVFSSQESVDTIVSLLKKGITNDEVRGALAQSVNFAIREVLSDQQTLNQLKIFIFFLLRKFENDDQIKGMMDILFAKGLGLVKKRKDPELQKILRVKKSDLVV